MTTEASGCSLKSGSGVRKLAGTLDDVGDDALGVSVDDVADPCAAIGTTPIVSLGNRAGRPGGLSIAGIHTRTPVQRVALERRVLHLWPSGRYVTCVRANRPLDG